MPTKAAQAKAGEFEAAFIALKQLLLPYESELSVKAGAPGEYSLETKSPSWRGKPMMFAAVTLKSYVAFHLFPVYLFPELAAGISPELKKRMQGKTCWNFRKVEPELFAELAAVVQAGFERFKRENYL